MSTHSSTQAAWQALYLFRKFLNRKFSDQKQGGSGWRAVFKCRKHAYQEAPGICHVNYAVSEPCLICLTYSFRCYSHACINKTKLCSNSVFRTFWSLSIQVFYALITYMRLAIFVRKICALKLLCCNTECVYRAHRSFFLISCFSNVIK